MKNPIHLAVVENTSPTKRETLAQLLKIDPAKLDIVSEAHCVRITTALTQCMHFVETYGLTYMALIRTPGIGARSAASLCNALGVPCNRKGVFLLEDHVSASGIAEEIAQHVQAHSLTPHLKLFSAIHRVDSPDLMVTTRDGHKFKISVQPIK